MPNFTFIKNYEIEDIKQTVMSVDESIWLSSTDPFRITSDSPHRETQSLTLSYVPIDWTPEMRYNMIIVNHIDLRIWEIIQDLESIMDGKVGRSFLIKLPPHKQVYRHVDAGFYLKHVRRMHVPILSHPDVLFHVGDESINMKEGECYEIDNTKPHSVDNNSDVPRVHLLVDVIPNTYLETIK